MSNLIDEILAEAEQELFGESEEFNKQANDNNGAPEMNAQGGQEQKDIIGIAQDFIAEVQQFKAVLGQSAAGAGGEQQMTPEDQAAVDQQMQQVPPGAEGAVVIQRPDGTQIKLAALAKLAALRGRALFAEV